MKNKQRILLLALVMFGIIATVSSATAFFGFDESVNVGGETFYIPEGYTLNSSKYEDSIYTDMYTKGTSGISILVYPDAPFNTDQFRLVQEDAGYFTYDATIGNYSGFEYTGDYGIHAFCFEKNGASVVIMVTPDFDFENDVEKIIG